MKKVVFATIVLTIILAASSGALEWKSRLGVGVRGPLMAPMVKGSDYRGYNNISKEPFMMGLGGNFEVKYGLSNSLVLGLSAGYWYSYDDTLSADDQSFKLNKKDEASTKLTVIPIGLTGQYYFIPESNIQPYLVAGLGIDIATYEDLMANEKYSSTDLNGKIGAGINFWIGESFAFDIGGRFSYLLINSSNDIPSDWHNVGDFSETSNRPFLATLEPGIGFTYFIGGARDTDKDGIKDKFDQCPDTPLGALVDSYGCPLDSDGDGIYDGIDQCPETPKGAFVDIIGCPLDSDADGIFDGLDKCPNTPLEVEVDARGCPFDTDGDGIPDFKDQQPDTPAGALVDEQGVAIDSDKDGIPDGIDKCTDTRLGVKVDEFGCPLAKPITDKMILNIKYAAGSVEPDEEATKVLDNLAERLKVYTDTKIELNGYTDALGSARSNLKLSQKRAEAVMEYLRAQGIAAERMSAKGYGEDPKFFIADNDTPEGRMKNRRVEVVPVR